MYGAWRVKKEPIIHPNSAGEISSPWTMPEVKIVGLYFIAASIWVIGSDWFLSSLRLDANGAHLIQTVKGLNFVVTTALLLYFVLRRAYGGWRRCEVERSEIIQEAKEKFRMLSARLQILREDERKSISREIHDELGQLLTGIKMELRLVENQLAEREDRTLNRSIDRIVETQDMVDTTISAVQRIAQGLRPGALDHLGLGTALIHEASRFTHVTGIPCAMVVQEIPENLSEELATTTFRIYQESLSNVARHADAHRIDSALSLAGDSLVLNVHDDGKGIDPAAASEAKSLGLVGMMERAANVGGTISFRRHPEKGTDVVFAAPVLRQNPELITV